MTETKPIDWNRPLQTRSGKPARLVGTVEGEYGFTHIVAVVGDNGYEGAYRTTEAGRVNLHRECHSDMVNTPERFVGWINIYRSTEGTGHHASAPYATEEEASLYRSANFVATRKVEFDL